MKKEKYQRGKEIFEEYKQRLNSSGISEDERNYFSEIVQAVEIRGYDAPIPISKMYKALEMAEVQNKKIEIVPDDDFLEGGACYGQCDGWTYHIELK